jgi:15-cis-phytoene synthase
MTMTSVQALIDAARDGEPDRLAAALLAPEPQRNALLALAAFSSELRRIPYAVKEPMMGEVRLQWWRDAIRTATPTSNPIADALLDAMTTYAWPSAVLIAMTEAHAFDLYADPMPDEAALHGYLAKTEGALFELGLRVMGRTPDGNSVALCTQAAQSYGLVRLFADLPIWLHRGRCPLPQSLFDLNSVAASDPPGTGLAHAMATLLSTLERDITATLDASRPRADTLSRIERLPFLPLAVVRPYLRQIKRASRSPLREPVALVPLRRMIGITTAWVLGRV